MEVIYAEELMLRDWLWAEDAAREHASKRTLMESLPTLWYNGASIIGASNFKIRYIGTSNLSEAAMMMHYQYQDSKEDLKEDPAEDPKDDPEEDVEKDFENSNE